MLSKEFDDELFDFQSTAVKIAAHHLNKRGGVVIGDVVGLGKTLMATALARVFEDDHGLETLIIFPKNLVTMWNDYRHQYRLRAAVLSISQVQSQLADMPRHRLARTDSRRTWAYKFPGEKLQGRSSRTPYLSLSASITAAPLVKNRLIYAGNPRVVSTPCCYYTR
jgi:hypothetical protein